jgi:hypothetical protein
VKSLYPSKPEKVPHDGLHLYMKNTWQTIKEQKELNLPDQREIVATYRCNEIKGEALKSAND